MFNNIEIMAGDTKFINVSVKNPSKYPIDISDCQITWIVTIRDNELEPVISKTLANGISITDANNGIFEITVDSEDTVAHSGKKYYHECKLNFNDGTVSTVLSGVFEIKRSTVRFE